MSDIVPLDLFRCGSRYICRVLEIRSVFVQLFSHMYFSFLERIFEWGKRRLLI